MKTTQSRTLGERTREEMNEENEMIKTADETEIEGERETTRIEIEREIVIEREIGTEMIGDEVIQSKDLDPGKLYAYK